jgi:hypothetical protein
MPRLIKTLVPLIACCFVSVIPSAHAQTSSSPLSLPNQEQTQSSGGAEDPDQQVICAGNVPPDGMVVTATGNSVECGGSCRSLHIVPVRGRIMVICAQQPIPQAYEIQSITSTPACNCLGEDDNAYVIRLPGAILPTPVPPPPLRSNANQQGNSTGP